MKQIKFIYVSILFIYIYAASAFSQVTTINLNDPLPNDTKVIVGKLDNGMTYYIRENKTPKNRAELMLVESIGSVNEDDDQQGLAHFCEHMAFNGTKNFPKHELIDYLESIGMKFGAEVNAYTSFDETVYGITVPLDSAMFLDKGLQILADWACNVSFDGEEIDKERGVIHEEWRLGRGPEGRMLQKALPKYLYNSRYADRYVIGKIGIIDSCPHDVLTRFYKDWYRPDLQAIVVVGDFDKNEMEKKIKSIFSLIPKANNPREKKMFEVPEHDETIVSIVTDKEASYTIAQVMYKHPFWIQQTVKDYRQSIVYSLYSSMITKRLNELVKQENPPFIYAGGGYENFIGPIDIYASIAVTKNDKLEIGLKTILLENERVKKYGFTATELEREKKSLLKSVETLYNEREKQESQSYANEYKNNFLMSKEPFPGIEYEYELFKKYMPEITLDEVNQLAGKWITDKNLVVSIMAPEKEDVKIPTEEQIKELVKSIKNEDVKPYEDKISTQPLFSEQLTPSKVDKKKEFKEVGVTEWTLKNGVKVVLKPTDFKDDEILFSAYSLGGASIYEQKDDISAGIAADVITESGVSIFPKVELDKMLSDKVVQVSPWISELQEGMNGSSSVNDFEILLQMINLYFTKPRMDKAAFNSDIERWKGEYENNSNNPQQIWRDTITVTMAQYHPRQRPWTAKILDEANYNRIHYIYKERFADGNNFTFFFVGSFDPEKIKPLIEKYLGGLPVVNRQETWRDLNIRTPKGKIDKTVYKGKEPISKVYLSFMGPFEYNVQNRITLSALCEVLTTKLLEVIREDKSGTYSIGAYPSWEHFPYQNYTISISFGCSPDNVENLTKSVLDVIEKIGKEGPTEIDVNKTKEKLQRTRETSLRENDYWLSKLTSTYFDNEELSKFYDNEKFIKALNGQLIKDAANKYCNMNNYVRIVLKPEK